MERTTIPQDLDDRYPTTLGEFCRPVRVSRRVVLDWHERGAGPRWTPFNGRGQLYVTTADACLIVKSEDFVATGRSGS